MGRKPTYITEEFNEIGFDIWHRMNALGLSYDFLRFALANRGINIASSTLSRYILGEQRSRKTLPVLKECQSIIDKVERDELAAIARRAAKKLHDYCAISKCAECALAENGGLCKIGHSSPRFWEF